MSSFQWPPSGSGGGVPTYTNLAAFPSAVTSGNGALAIALDTNILYESNGTSWVAIAGPGDALALGAFGSTPNANGLSLSGAGVLNMQPADGTHPGGLSIVAQTVAGAKTFSTAPILSSLTVSTGLQLDASKNVISATLGTLTEVTSSVLTLGSWSNATFGSPTIQVTQATTSTSGYLSSTDWNTFNGKLTATLTSGDIFVGNGSNVATAVAMSGDATLANTGAITFATVNTNTGSFGSTTAIPSFTVNGKGLITAASTNVVIAPAGTLSGTTLNSTVVTSSLTSVGSQAQALNMNSHLINNVTDPSSAQDAATKNYVDTVASGLQTIQAVTAATTANIPGTYVQVGGGIGDTFTITATTTFTVDGITPTLGQRILFKNQTTGQQNGVYNITTLANVGVLGAIFTRALDYDTVSDVNAGDLVPVISGTANGTTSWLQTATVSSIGTSGTPMVFAQWTANPANYLLKANNLSDVSTKATAFNNLSPMTTGGDLIYGGASGAGTRLANGSSGQVLTSNGTTLAPSWQAVSAATKAVCTVGLTTVATFGPNGIFKYDTVITDTASGYSVSTGLYTTNVTGNFLVSVNIYASSGDNGQTDIFYVQVNSTNIVALTEVVVNSQVFSGSAIVAVTSGQTIGIQQTVNSVTYAAKSVLGAYSNYLSIHQI